MHAEPTAHPFLTRFFLERRGALPEDRRVALDGVACDLLLAVETMGEQLLDADGLVLLDAERQFDRVGAVGRLLALPELVRVLERYASDPALRPADTADAKLRVETLGLLLRRLAAQPALSGRARLLRRADEAIRIEAGALGPLRRLRVRRVRS